jgi:hypothetical protein
MLVFIAISAFFAVGVGYSLYQSHKENTQVEQESLEMDLDIAPQVSNQKEV